MVKKLISNLSVILSLLILGIFLLSFYNISIMIQRLESKLTISAFLMNSFIDTQKINNSIIEIKKIDSAVKEVLYISKDKALDEFLLRNPELAEQIKIFGNNPLPASLEIQLASPVRLEEVKNLTSRLSGLEGIKSVEYPELEMKKIIWIRELSNKIYLIVLGILIFFNIFFITQINRLNIILNKYTQDTKPNLLKEVIPIGFFSGVIVIILLYCLFYIFTPKITYLEFLPLGYIAGILIFSVIIPGVVHWYFQKYRLRGD